MQTGFVVDDHSASPAASGMMFVTCGSKESAAIILKMRPAPPEAAARRQNTPTITGTGFPTKRGCVVGAERQYQSVAHCQLTMLLIFVPFDMSSISKRPFLYERSHIAGPWELSIPILLNKKPPAVLRGSARERSVSARKVVHC